MLQQLRVRYAEVMSYGVALPLFVGLWLFMVILPLMSLVVYSFLSTRGFRVEWTVNLDTWIGLFESGRWTVTVRTLRIAITITVIEFLIAFPFAYWLAKVCHNKLVQAVVITLLTIPFFLDLSSRALIWRAILGNEGLLNSMLIEMGLSDQPVAWLLFSEFAVHFGMLAPYFATMFFPIYLVVSLIDDEYLDAARDLGASPAFLLITVVLPLALPGIVGGVVFTLVPAMAEYVVPHVMGGFMINMIGKSVESALSMLRYPTAAALSTFVIMLLVALLAVLVRFIGNWRTLDSVFRAMNK